MTRIRRINVSQIEGGNADNADINEIRPNGETAFYLDNNNKLTLMMFDGVRTHQKSKVLAPGVLYGSNADAGDGSTADTIKLIPDAALGSDQYIVVDPTAPNHIHIRAGGTIDSSTAELYIGGENNHFRVNDNGYAVIKADNSLELNIGNSNYLFSYDQMLGSSFQIPGGIQGALQPSFLSSNGLGISIDGFNTPNTVDIGNIPSSTVLRLRDGDGAGNIIVQSLGTSLKLQTGNTSTWELNSNGSLTLPNNAVIRTDGSNVEVGNVTNFNVEAVGVVNIYTDTNGETPYQWQFGNDGGLTFPDATVQTTAYTGGGDATGVSRSDDNLIIRLTDPNNDGLELRSIVVDGNDMNVSSTVLGANGFVISTNSNVSQKQWQFGNDGGVTFPDTTVQTTAYVAADNVTKVTGTWTVTTGTNDYSFTVPVNGVYQLWARANIPNGIISYTATAAVTNSNVPVLGTQYAWNYTGAGNPILFTTLPTQFIGTEGTISTSNPSVGTSTNTFVFGLQNNTAEDVTVEYGYTKIS